MTVWSSMFFGVITNGLKRHKSFIFDTFQIKTLGIIALFYQAHACYIGPLNFYIVVAR